MVEITQGMGSGQSDAPATEQAATGYESYHALFESAFEFMDEGWCILEKTETPPDAPSDFRYVAVNPAFERHTGLTNVVGRTIIEVLTHAEDRMIEVYDRVLQTGESVRFEGVMKSLNLWVKVYAFPLKGAAPNRVSVLFTNINERKKAEAARNESDERFRLLVEGARDYSMFLMDAQSCITFWSGGAERVFGWTEAEMQGQPLDRIFTPEDRAAGETDKERDTALSEGRAVDRRWHLRKNGSRFWADGLLMRLNDDAGHLRGFVKIARDATDEKRADDTVQAAMREAAQANEQLEARVRERTKSLDEMSRMRQELLRRLVTAQEMERARIARDLHDDTGQQITALQLGLSRLKNSPAFASDAEAWKLIERMQALAGEVAQKSHRLSFTLRPTVLDDQGLMEALQNYTESWCLWSGVPVDLQGIGMEADSEENGATFLPRTERLPSEIETTIYRVTQEALTNVLRHAVSGDGEKRRTAQHVSIMVRRGAEIVVVLIEDDGPGFDVEATLSLPPGRRRLGIFGMQERARLAGGTLTVESQPNQGTTVLLRLPLTPERRGETD